MPISIDYYSIVTKATGQAILPPFGNVYALHRYKQICINIQTSLVHSYDLTNYDNRILP